MRLAEYLSSENQWLPWNVFADALGYCDVVLSSLAEHGSFRAVMRRLVEKQYTAQSWQLKPGFLDRCSWCWWHRRPGLLPRYVMRTILRIAF